MGGGMPGIFGYFIVNLFQQHSSKQKPIPSISKAFFPMSFHLKKISSIHFLSRSYDPAPI